MLTAEEITATYGELETMFVPLRPEPELGLDYIKERLALCRAMQDRLAELRLKTNQHLTDVLERSLKAKALLEVQSTPDMKNSARELEIVKQRHAMLVKMIGYQMQVLGRTAMDIRLLHDITKQQIQRGEINPHDSPQIIQQVDPAEMVQEFSPSVIGPIEKQEPPTQQEFQQAWEHMFPTPTTVTSTVTSAVEGVVTFDTAPAPAPKPEDRVKLSDTNATSFEELFGGLDGPHTANPF